VLFVPQSITFTPPTIGLVGQSVTLSATGGGSGNPVVFSVDPASGSGVCNVSGTNGTTLVYDAPGTCVIDADQAGNVSDAAAPTVTATIVVDQVPTFTQDSPPATFTTGRAYAYAFAADGAPAPEYSLGAGAPSWLSLDATSGALSGTPPAGTTSFAYSIVATNGVGSATAGPCTVTVQPVTEPHDADISAALACPPSVPIGTVATCTLTVTNGGPATAHRVSAALVLPFGFRRMSSTPAGRWFGHMGFWFVGHLDPGESATLTVSFGSWWPTDGTVLGVGWAANPDPSRSNNVATAAVSFVDTGPES
jgi:Domain of unknown function DUF11/Putative Ig domain